MGFNWEELIVAAGDTVELIRPLLISLQSKMRLQLLTYFLAR